MGLITITTPTAEDPVEIKNWLSVTQDRLREHWVTTTGHFGKARFKTWACELAHKCRTCNEHLSIPCSLLREANEIGVFLESACYSEKSEVFFRLYLMILSEFVNQLRDVAALVKVKVPKPPKLVVMWANRWAKHRLSILVQHHPMFFFADNYGDGADEFFADLAFGIVSNECGDTRGIRVVDTAWLQNQDGRPNLVEANSELQTIIAVPPLMAFLKATIQYFRDVLDSFLADLEKIKRFEAATPRNYCC